MSVVTASRYNALQTKVSNVLGTGSSDKGYGVTVTSGQVAAGDVVTASHLALAHADINKCILHQTASATSAIVSLEAGDTIEETNATTKKGWAQYETEATAAETNRLNAAAGNFTTATEVTETRSSAWGGSTDTINTTYTVTFSSANANDPLVIIKNTASDAAGARLRFVKDKGAAGAANDVAGLIEFYADDANQAFIVFNF